MEGGLEHVETGRAPASAFLLIDSQDRIQSASSDDAVIEVQVSPESVFQPLNNFIIYKRQPFLTGYFHRIAVTELRMELSIPNINERNNAIVFGISGEVTPFVVEITEGFYTPSELAAELQAELTSSIPAYTWAVTFANEYFTITCNEKFVITPYSYPTLSQTVRGLFYMMNFSSTVNSVTERLSQVSMNHPPLVYTRYIDICSRNLTQYQKVKDNSTRENQTPAVLARVYLTNDANPNYPGSSGQVIQRIYNVPKYSSWSPGQFIDQIDIQLRDDAGNLLYIDYNAVQAESGVKGAIENQNSFQLTLHCSES